MIVTDGDRQCEVNGRLAEMIRFLLDRQDAIAETANIKVEYNCAGCRIESKLIRFESEAKVMDAIE